MVPSQDRRAPADRLAAAERRAAKGQQALCVRDASKTRGHVLARSPGLPPHRSFKIRGLPECPAVGVPAQNAA
ncbi:hypothetical protein U0C82_08385 [Fulvimarina sp. 2208YS6-2-32]|uniref:Uncharacterized protein n=1 Tax=Fulvimarina uroteuthidis TaxID=3098149 RepID=A0ABU5I4S1_9HYPH|nr:hypothetical protein [Fulvimarina sp. 2208YS6-2-32]MDY8109161.1 hypothetical protein [Fulvimarina sp. 2208YS6-2-32]